MTHEEIVKELEALGWKWEANFDGSQPRMVLGLFEIGIGERAKSVRMTVGEYGARFRLATAADLPALMLTKIDGLAVTVGQAIGIDPTAPHVTKSDAEKRIAELERRIEYADAKLCEHVERAYGNADADDYDNVMRARDEALGFLRGER